jgi:hypothetical protein
MSYYRVIPRDLFNEANLLKCYAQIYLNLERLPDVDAQLVGGDNNYPFRVDQNIDGSTWLANILLIVRGEPVTLERPLNSREKWPLGAAIKPDDPWTFTDVFDDVGAFSPEMLAFLKGE